SFSHLSLTGRDFFGKCFKNFLRHKVITITHTILPNVSGFAVNGHSGSWWTLPQEKRCVKLASIERPQSWWGKRPARCYEPIGGKATAARLAGTLAPRSHYCRAARGYARPTFSLLPCRALRLV